MAAVFENVLNMTVTASFAIIAVLVCRAFMRRAPKVFSYILWAVVLFRLLCPVSLPSPMALLGLLRPEVTVSEHVSQVAYLPPEMPERAAAFVSAYPNAAASAPEQSGMSLYEIGAVLWLLGIAVMVLYSAVTFFRLRRELQAAVCLGDGVYMADRIGSAFVLGVLRPRVYLPSYIRGEERRMILAHEKHHIRRGDHIFKLLAWMALCLHWFNPLVWVAFFQAGKDMEMSCDEAVIRKLGSQVRADYAQSLLRLATYRHIIAFSPLAFGEGDTKGRVNNMAKWKKPKLWLSILCAAVCIGVMAACGLNPETRTLSLGEMTLTLPAEFSDKASQKGGITFLLKDKEAGGLEIYTFPEGTETENVSADTLAQAVGLEETAMEMMAYMGGSSAYADMEINYFYEPDPNSWNRTHYFFLTEGKLYDLWFDENLVNIDKQIPILQAASVTPASASREEGDIPAGEDVDGTLSRCRAVVEMAASSDSCWILMKRTNEGGNVLNETSTTDYYRCGEDWLMTFEIPESGILDGVPVWFSRFAYMYKNGRYYDNERDGSLDEHFQVKWAESTQKPVWEPWLLTFEWEDEKISYVSTLPEGSGYAVTLQINEPYKDREDSYPGYYVVFHFNDAGAFRHVDVQASFVCEGEDDLHIIERESIVTLEKEIAAEEIERQYARATNQE